MRQIMTHRKNYRIFYKSIDNYIKTMYIMGNLFINRMERYYIYGVPDDMEKVYNNWAQITYKIETEINKE